MKTNLSASYILITLFLANFLHAGTKRKYKQEDIPQSHKRFHTIHDIAGKTDLEDALSVITAKENINKENCKKRTPLHIAVSKGHFFISKLLLQCGAEVNKKDLGKWTPLHLAARKGHFDLLKLLILHKANITAIGPNGYTPLHFAVSYGHEEATNLLVLLCTNINQITESGFSPLHLCASKGFTNIAKLLLNAGADINVLSNTKCTPLHMSIINNQESITTLLLKQSALVDPIDKHGSTPLHLAIDKKNTHVATLLLAHGAKVDRLNGLGRTPLHVAARNTDIDMIKLLRSHQANCMHTSLGSNLTPLEVYLLKKIPSKDVINLLFDFNNIKFLALFQKSSLHTSKSHQVKSHINKAAVIIAREYTQRLFKQNQLRNDNKNLALALLLHEAGTIAHASDRLDTYSDGLKNALYRGRLLLKDNNFFENIIDETINELKLKSKAIDHLSQVNFELALKQSTDTAVLTTLVTDVQNQIENGNQANLEQYLMQCTEKEHIKAFLDNIIRFGQKISPSIFITEK